MTEVETVGAIADDGGVGAYVIGWREGGRLTDGEDEISSRRGAVAGHTNVVRNAGGHREGRQFRPRTTSRGEGWAVILTLNLLQRITRAEIG